MNRKFAVVSASSLLASILVGVGPLASAQPTTQPTAQPTADAAPAKDSAQPASETALPPVTVTAERRTQSPQDVPVSLSNIDATSIQNFNIENVKQASELAPNLNISQFTPPRESYPYVRGIGSGENSPAVATYIDGVPQLTSSTSNIQLVDIDRIEFLRGPQGTLYGRNTLGGVINIYSQQPTDTPHGDITASGGNYSLQDYRGGFRGPIVPGEAYYAVAGGYESRDGYSINNFTGNDLDHVNELFGRVELRFLPQKNWDLRFTLNGERDADGDFPLSDLDALRAHPRRVDHDYEGEAHRNVGQVAFNAIYHGQDVEFTSVTALNYFNSKELTDLDETAFNLARRSNQEQQRTITEEVRLLSPNDHPLVLCNEAKFSWVVGSLMFFNGDEPRVANTETALAVPPVGLTSFQNSNIDATGIGVYGQGTVTVWDKLDLTLGGRVDYEYQHASLSDTFAPAAAAPAFSGSDQKDYTQFQPKFAADYHLTKDWMAYGLIEEGYRAGGFNSTFPTPSQVSFGPERAWSYELGTKASLLGDRLRVSADVFHIDWHHLQLDTPIPGEPSAFYISNAGDARSTGAELQGDYQVLSGLDVFAGLGFTHARFERAFDANGNNAEGHRLPQAPETTWNIGAQYTLPLPHELKTYARVEVIGVGPYSYDASNVAGQGAYVLTNFRVGVGSDTWRLEGWINNAFNTNYVPIAYQFPGSPSGYVGESGDPMTAGVTVGWRF